MLCKFIVLYLALHLINLFIYSNILLLKCNVSYMWYVCSINYYRFDELHHGKYVSLYMKRTFFFDTHPPFGKQLIAAVAYLCNYDGMLVFIFIFIITNTITFF